MDTIARDKSYSINEVRKMEKSHIFNISAGFIIIAIWIFHTAMGGDPAFPLFMIGLFVISYFMERKGVSTFYWAALTTFLLIISLWTMAPRLFFGP